MSFYDAPKVDCNATRSEESVLNVRTVLTRKAGFISREELPDYGVDLNVELVAGENATSNIFPLQIKSTGNIDVITHDGVQYISIEFLTSRLGYLCNRPPSYGIVVVYDERSRVSYFDFVEEIVMRLNEHRGDTEWMNQESVSIRIPLVVLDAAAATQIHEKMASRFLNNQSLINAYGGLYRIPSLKASTDQTDFNDPKQVAAILTTSGMDLFNSKAYTMVTDLLARLRQSTISGSRELMLLAAVTYGQTGMIIECGYYLKRCAIDPESYNEDERFLLRYTEIMMKFKIGDLGVEQFKKEITLLKTKSRNQINILTLDINLIYLRFLQGSKGNLDTTLLAAIDEVFSRIRQSDLAASDKALLKLFNLENLHNYGTGLLLRDGGRLQIQEKLGLHISMQERVQRVQEILRIMEMATSGVHEILKESVEGTDRLVMAFAAYYKARFFFAMQFQMMMLRAGEPESASENHRAVYDNTLTICYQSISLFHELSLLHEVHQALSCAYDLQLLYRIQHQAEVGKKTLEEIAESLRNVERATGIRKYESIIEPALANLAASKESHDGSWSNVPDNQVEDFARIVLDAQGIPQDRLPNIVLEIRALKAFASRCTNPDLDLLFDLRHTASPKTAYSNRPIFFIRSKRTGIESQKSSDIDWLLNQCSGILGGDNKK